MRCCRCGVCPNVKECPACGHYFGDWCRGALFWRGLAAVKEHLFKSPPKHCAHR